MAKKRAARSAATTIVEPPPRQTQIPGTFDPVPAVVQEACDEYVHAKRQVAAWRERMNGAEERLIDLMIEHDIAKMLIDDGEKKIRLVARGGRR